MSLKKNVGGGEEALVIPSTSFAKNGEGVSTTSTSTSTSTRVRDTLQPGETMYCIVFFWYLLVSNSVSFSLISAPQETLPGDNKVQKVATALDDPSTADG